LLAGVKDQCQTHTLAKRLVLPESGVVARDGFLFVFDGLTDLQELLLYFFLSITDLGKSGAGLIDFVSSLDIPVSGQYWMLLKKKYAFTLTNGDYQG
jgi:hypothetical protein